ncbi:type IX secretion system membrane protein PorP/SprF [Paracrocinitomix mangrovi]|uniref:PorP/SprF family type IX secretion system membrane protein n=1 Tax=Paracrocinitomix mangrovi TaxID=2862509 RepID=UPI001C8D34D1|nr:type IX secretion system membrane protein PorP/SprF [Paracrocinitomix mangrovi]UKN01526.1 type IX secretion system membrane protein PorP/SprF [Paracrocinitomix mangrovi]
MKRIFTILLAISSIQGLAQDPEFTQFYANPIYLNPAMAGTHGCPRIAMNHRNQWPSLSGAFITNTISYDQYSNILHGGIAVQVTNDMAGKNTLNWSTINLAYSYHLAVTREFSFLFGAQATWNQKFLDWSKLSFGDQIDPRRGFIYQTGDLPRGNILDNGWGTRGYFDVSAGIVGFSKHFYFGFAAKHLNKPDESLIIGTSRLPMRFTGHMGANIVFGKQSQYRNQTSLSPNIIYTYQDGFMQLNIGTYIKYGVFTAGAWWRARDAFILTIGIDAGSFRFGYSYDVTISKLTNASGGSHELSLAFLFNCRDKPKKFRTISCPSF